MDITSALFLIVFVVLGGVIAIIADELGRRIGKKRLVLHRRIRPKTTARIITFFSGMMITILTIVLLYLSSNDVRVWLKEGTRAAKQRDALRADVADLTKKRIELQNGTEVLKVEVRNLEANRSELQKNVAKLGGDLKALGAKYLDSEAKVKAQLARITGLSSRLTTLTLSIARAEKAKVEATNQLRAEQVSYKKLKTYYDVLSKQQAELSQHDLDLDQKLKQKEQELAAKQADINVKTRQVADADAAVQKLTADKSRLEDEIAVASDKVQAAQRDLDDLRNQAGQFARAFRDADLMFARGEEMTRIDLPAQISKNQARGLLDDAIAQARGIAKKNGARQTSQMDYADLPHTGPHGELVSVDAQEDFLAAGIAGSPNEQVLIVFSAFNAFEGEPVILGLTQQPNPLLYQPGQVLADIRVDGRKDRKEILQSLNGLVTRVRARALKDHMIPIQKGDRSLGIVTSEDIIDLYDKIKASRGSVKVQARARRLTRAADPLLLDFEVQ